MNLYVNLVSSTLLPFMFKLFEKKVATYNNNSSSQSIYTIPFNKLIKPFISTE